MRPSNKHLHEICGDSVGAAGDGFELHPVQVYVFGQAPLQHVSCHTETCKNTLPREGPTTKLL